jgi:hypothetical protein
MRRLKRSFLPLLCGLLVALTILFWPASPRWSKPVSQPGRKFKILDPWTPSERLFVEELKTPEGAGADVVERSIADAHAVSRFPLPAEDGDFYIYGKRLIPGGDKIFVVQESFDKERKRAARNDHTRDRQYKVLESRSGQILAGPFDYDGLPWEAFSPDGCWVSVHPRQGQDCLVVQSIMTGKAVLRFRGGPPHALPMCVFSPDSRYVAVLWDKNEKYTVGVYELPSGKMRMEHELPQRKSRWTRIVGWTGELLSIRDEHDCAHSLDVLPSSLGKPRPAPKLNWASQTKPSGEVQTLDAGKRVVRFLMGDPKNDRTWVETAFAWIDEHLGTRFYSPHYERSRVQVRDRESWRRLLEVETQNHDYFSRPTPPGSPLSIAKATSNSGMSTAQRAGPWQSPRESSPRSPC